MRIFLVMQEGCGFGELGAFNGSVAQFEHNALKETLRITEHKGKSTVMNCKDILLFGTLFGQLEIPIINNMEQDLPLKSAMEDGTRAEEEEDGTST